MKKTERDYSVNACHHIAGSGCSERAAGKIPNLLSNNPDRWLAVFYR